MGELSRYGDALSLIESLRALLEESGD